MMIRRTKSRGSAFIASVALLLTMLTACGDSSSDNAGTGESMGGLPGTEKTSIKVGISADDPHQYALQLAIDAGIFKKYGINAEGRYFNGSSPTVQALLAGQVDVATSNATNVITSLTTSRPLVDIGVMVNKLPDVFYGGSGINNANDLRDKKVAISQFGGQSHTEVIVALDQLGLTPDDVFITQTSGQSERIAALQAGTVAAAPADPALADQLAGSGIKPLVDLRTTDVRAPGSDIAMRLDTVEKNPNLTLIIAAAALEAVQMEFTDTAKVAQYYAKWAKISDADSTKLWNDYVKSGLAQRNLRSNVDAYKVVQEVLVTQNPAVADVDLSKAYDDSYLNKLQELGMFEKLGVPTGPGS